MSHLRGQTDIREVEPVILLRFQLRDVMEYFWADLASTMTESQNRRRLLVKSTMLV